MSIRKGEYGAEPHDQNPFSEDPFDTALITKLVNELYSNASRPDNGRVSCFVSDP